MRGRVGFVINQLGGVGSGGSDRVVCLLANALSRRGWQVDICVLTDDPTIERELDSEVRVRFLGRIASRSKQMRILFRILFGIAMVRAYRREHRDALVVSFIAWVNICAVLGSIGRTRGLLLSERTDPATDPSSGLARFVRDRCYRAADAIVFQTPDALKHFGRRIAARGHVIGNPVTPNLPQWRSSIETAPVRVAAACRLESQKNLPMLFNAFSLFLEKHPDASLTVYGEGKQRRELESMLRSLGLTDRVELAGYVNDVHERLASASFFVLSSDYEGMPNSLLEAMAMGMPVVATDCAIGGPRMLIEDGVDGLLVPVGDPRAMADALAALADDPARTAEFGAQARIKTERYEVGRVLDRWEQLLIGHLEREATRV